MRSYVDHIPEAYQHRSYNYPSTESGEWMQGWLHNEQGSLPYYPLHENHILFMKHSEQAHAAAIQAHAYDSHRAAEASFGREEMNASLFLNVYVNGQSIQIEVRRGGTVKLLKSRLHTMADVAAPEPRYQQAFYAGEEVPDDAMWGDLLEDIEDGAQITILETVSQQFN